MAGHLGSLQDQLTMRTLLFLLLAAVAHATVHNATTASRADVGTALALCVSGDTLGIPAGTATWSTVLPISGLALTIQGAGEGSTFITDGTTGTPMINIICNSTNFVRLTGLTINTYSGTNTDGPLQIQDANQASSNTVGFRVDHITININAISRGCTVMGAYGLFDHNTFKPTVAGSIHAIDIYGSQNTNDGGITPWTRPLTLGTDKAVYIENCTFDFRLNDQSDDSIDCYGGARWVIRYNAFLDISNGSHGLDSGGTQSPHSFEIYNNTYTNNSSHTLRVTTVRGGTGVIYNNTYGGTHGSWDGVTLQYYRANNTAPSWAQCDGTNWRINAVDPTQSGYWVLNTTGTYAYDNATNTTIGTYGGSNTTYFDGAGTLGYPGREQPGYTTGQVPSPIYIWGNSGQAGNTAATWDGTGVNVPPYSTFMQINREWYEGTAKPGYTAYTYPNPLIGGGGTTSGASSGKVAFTGKVSAH